MKPLHFLTLTPVCFMTLVFGLLSSAMMCSSGYRGSGKPVVTAPESAPEGPFKIPDDDLARRELGGMVFEEGILDLVPDFIGAAGEVRYSLYENGVITYEGFATFFGQYQTAIGGASSDSKEFRGAIQAKPESVASWSYLQVGKSRADYLAHMEVMSLAPNLATVAVTALPYQAKGEVIVNISKKLISIERAQISGTVWGFPVSIQLVARSK